MIFSVCLELHLTYFTSLCQASKQSTPPLQNREVCTSSARTWAKIGGGPYGCASHFSSTAITKSNYSRGSRWSRTRGNRASYVAGRGRGGDNDYISRRWSLQGQVFVERESGVEGVAQVAEQSNEITAEPQVPKSPIGTLIINALEVGGSSTANLINNPPSPHLRSQSSVCFSCPYFDSFLLSFF